MQNILLKNTQNTQNTHNTQTKMLDFEIIVFIVMLIAVGCFMHPILMEEIPCVYFSVLTVSGILIILKLINIMAITIMVKFLILCGFIYIVICIIYIFIVNCFY